MATIREGTVFTQIVRFDVRPDQQAALIDAIAKEIERWIRHRPGFVSSTLHASLDGRHVVNYAQWQDAAAFRGFLEDPQARHLQQALKTIDPKLAPHAVQCRVARSFG